MIQRISTFIEDLRDRWADRHSRIKVAKIRRVFAREGGLIHGDYSSSLLEFRICDHPGRCAMGALLVAAGVMDHEANDGMTDEHYTLIERVYGLVAFEASTVINTNDSRYNNTNTPVWDACGIDSRPPVEVRVCVVNDKVRELASA